MGNPEIKRQEELLHETTSNELVDTISESDVQQYTGAELDRLKQQIGRLQEKVEAFRLMATQLRDKVSQHDVALDVYNRDLRAMILKSERDWRDIDHAVKEVLFHVKKANGVHDFSKWISTIKFMLWIIGSLILLVGGLVGIKVFDLELLK